VPWRERRAQKHAEQAHARAIAAWQKEQSLADQLASVARAAASGSITVPGVILKTGEVGLWSAPASLIEPRVQQGHYEGRSSGVSLHIAKGVNYRVGAFRGHYVPGPELQTPVDRGQAFVTSQRTVFIGSRTTREWLYGKLIGVDSSSDDHTVLLHVSNRQKVSGLSLAQHGPNFQTFLALGVAISQHGAAAIAQQCTQAAEAHRAQQP
jgi:hypothetical protein